MSIHPTAIIDSAAEIGEGVVIGPYTIIGPKVTIGANCTIGSHSRFDGTTTIGANNTFGSFNAIGADAQDLSYDGREAFLEIGEANTFGDYVQLCRGTVKSGDLTTRVGSKNFLMAYCHLGHDCQVGDSNTFANNVHLGGHCEVDGNVMIGGNSAAHQFCAFGRFSMIGGGSAIDAHVAPFVRCNGLFGNQVSGLNTVGLQRSGLFDRDAMRMAKDLYKIFFRQGGKLDETIAKMRETYGGQEHAETFISFIEKMRTGDFARRPIARSKKAS